MGGGKRLTDLRCWCWWCGWDVLWLFKDGVGISAGLLSRLPQGGLQTAQWPSQRYCAHAGLSLVVARAKEGTSWTARRTLPVVRCAVL